jgi:nitrile hydratase
MDGFGSIHREADEPVFHELWQGRVFGMFLSGVGLPPTRFDSDRYRIEQLVPVKYLSSGYYERWLAALESGLLQTGKLTQEEIEARVQQLAGNPNQPMPRHEDPEKA